LSTPIPQLPSTGYLADKDWPGLGVHVVALLKVKLTVRLQVNTDGYPLGCSIETEIVLIYKLVWLTDKLAL
jgi:hypothetical protein